MHERIRLAIITTDKAKTLAGVEELDGAGGPLSRQLALCGSRFAPLSFDQFAYNRQIAGRNLAATLDELEVELLALGKGTQAGCLDSADMDEGIFAAIFALDEAEAFVRVEELYSTAPLADHLCWRTASALPPAEAASTAGTAKAAPLITAKAVVSAAKAVVSATEPVAATATVSSVKRHS